MSRFSALLVAAGLAAGTVGCAQCDTCDDFPAPCIGPNCGVGGAYGGSAPANATYSGPAAPATPVMSMPPASPGAANDGAAPIPSAPAVNPSGNAKPSDSSPPKPTELSRPSL